MPRASACSPASAAASTAPPRPRRRRRTRPSGCSRGGVSVALTALLNNTHALTVVSVSGGVCVCAREGESEAGESTHSVEAERDVNTVNTVS